MKIWNEVAGPSVREEVARLLLELGCVQVSPKRPFTYASGLKGPLYCDNRQLLSHPQARNKVIDHLMQALKTKLAREQWQYERLAGLATAGIPYAAMVADRLEVPMIYIRSAPKEHGKGQQVEGHFKAGDRVILFEDLVNQAKSLQSAVTGAVQEGLRPLLCLCLVDYQMSTAQAVLQQLDLPLYALTNFETLLHVAQNMGVIAQSDIPTLKAWQAAPLSWQAPQ